MLNELLARQKPGYALEQAFYLDADVYRQDVERIVLRSWILVGHSSQIAEPGQFLVSEIAGESIIVVRNDAGEINALLNVCRHRGSRVCREDQGRTSRFVCPYHAWTYDLDGQLVAAPRMMDSVDVTQLPLKQVSVEEFHGLLFVNFGPDADFASIREELSGPLAPYDLANAKIAHRQNYEIDANWKLGVENFCECYHCLPAHREYSVAHSLARPEKATPELREAVLAKAESCGLWPNSFDASYTASEVFGNDSFFSRTPLLKGHVTGSRDGKPVAPLLGSIKDYDGGASDFQIGPISFGLAYCDYVVLYRFIPKTKDQTDCEVIWLVRGDAEEGKDYQLDDLIWLWDVTTIADKRIIQDNARGVESRFYEPGPYAEMENYTQQFAEWYLNVLKN